MTYHFKWKDICADQRAIASGHYPHGADSVEAKSDKQAIQAAKKSVARSTGKDCKDIEITWMVAISREVKLK